VIATRSDLLCSFVEAVTHVSLRKCSAAVIFQLKLNETWLKERIESVTIYCMDTSGVAKLM
jgi:hypothetical protein